jgi:alkylhydroperoxidase family enzyme
VTTPSPRIAPLPVADWDDDAVAALRAAFGEQGAAGLLTQGPDPAHVPNVLTTLMRHPALAGPFLVYNQVLLRTPTLEPRVRELVILRIASRTASTYEWVQHVRIARTCGVAEDEIAALASGAADHGWHPLDADLLAATDQLLDRYRIDDSTWARLARCFDEQQMLELTFVVGTYTCLAMVFNSVGLELDPELHSVDAPSLPGLPADGAPDGAR